MSKKVVRKTKKSTKIIISIILLILIAIITFFCLRIFTEKDKTNPQIPTNTQEVQLEAKSEEITTEDKSSDITKVDGVEVIDESDPNNSEVITGVITRAAKLDNGKFRIIAMTDQALSEGNCELTFMDDSKTLESTSEIIAHANSSNCSFEFDSAEITPGNWNINIKITTTKNRSGVIMDSIEVKE